MGEKADALSDPPPDPPSLPISMAISDILCEHGSLDPLKPKDMKRISRVWFPRFNSKYCKAYAVFHLWMIEDSGFYNTDDKMYIWPGFATLRRVCWLCLKSVPRYSFLLFGGKKTKNKHLFTEKLYDKEHSRYVKQFDELSPINEDDEIGYWISKKWCKGASSLFVSSHNLTRSFLKDWKLMKPKMHEPGKDDPAPDSEEFHSHVFCEHGGLSLNTTNRRKISAAVSSRLTFLSYSLYSILNCRQSVELLQTLFPTWNPPSSESETCAVCDAAVHISKEDKKEVRRQAEEEKVCVRLTTFIVHLTKFMRPTSAV